MFGILRTVLAINVVLLHIFQLPLVGNYSVIIFFILSGFLMTLIVQEKYGYSIEGFKFFWINRILRLYPVYWVVALLTIIFLLVAPDLKITSRTFLPNSIFEWVSNLTLVFPEFVPYRFIPRLSSPTWALTNELLFYLLISLGISKSYKRTIIWVVLSLIYFILTYYFLNLPKYRYGALFASSLPFSLGSLLYWFVKDFRIKFNSISPAIIIYCIFLVNATIATHSEYLLKEICSYINILIGLSLIFYLYNIKLNQRSKSIDKYIGFYSYPLYISHFLALMIYQILFEGDFIGDSFQLDLSALIPYFAVLLLTDIILVHFVDIKIDRIKRRLKPKWRLIKTSLLRTKKNRK